MQVLGEKIPKNHAKNKGMVLIFLGRYKVGINIYPFMPYTLEYRVFLTILF